MADPVAEVLAEHRDWIISETDKGPRIVCEGGDLDYGDARVEQLDLEERIAAHLAGALRAKGLVPEQVAWLYGVQTGPDTFYPCPSRESALSELALRRAEPDPAELPHLRLVRSPVYPRQTPWRPADEGSE